MSLFSSLKEGPWWLKPLLFLTTAVAVGYMLFLWFFCRVEVGPGEILIVKSRFGDELEPGQVLAEPHQKGIQKEVRGEGRHFINPLFYDTEWGKIITIPPDQVGLVTSKVGQELPEGEFLANENQKGMWKRVLTPGKWRLNPYGYEVKLVPATIIRPGFVGCVTSLSGTVTRSAAESDPSGAGEPAAAETGEESADVADASEAADTDEESGDSMTMPAAAEGPALFEKERLAGEGERGIQKNVLQAGIYYLNPRQFKVESVEVGYRQLSLNNIAFRSREGFNVALDTSVIWGLHPDNVPMTIMHFGNIQDVVNKVIEPQVVSICRTEGAKNRAQDFIEGEKRKEFQDAFTNQLRKIVEDKNLEAQIALVRDIQVPDEIRVPIQDAKVAVEVELTKVEQIESQKVYNELELLKAEVAKGVQEVAADTEKVVAQTAAEGDREVAQIQAKTQVEVAVLQRQVAELQADKSRKLGRAEAEVTELTQAAEADRFFQNVQAIGSSAAYANYVFATGLPLDMDITLRYAGEGTFWTDLSGATSSAQQLAAMELLRQKASDH